MSESVNINFAAPVAFPQPIASRDEIPGDKKYWYPYVGVANWTFFDDADLGDARRLAQHMCYATREECAQRIAYDAQEMARLVIPGWFRKLGPDVEFACGSGIWRDIEQYPGGIGAKDWSNAKPERYRAKPRDVVVTVNGREFRWPETVKSGEPRGPRHIVNGSDIVTWLDSTISGAKVHHTRAGAESQLAAIRAAAGESL
jgi:hypothetical protein